MEYILSIETCGGLCSVALGISEINRVVEAASSQHDNINQQAEVLLNLTDGILKKAKIGYSSLSHIAVTKGPGSFTGCRIGLAFAYGIKLAQPNINIIAISTLSCLAAQYYKNDGSIEEILVQLPAGAGQIYEQKFTNKCGAVQSISGIIMKEVPFHGEGAPFYKEKPTALGVLYYIDLNYKEEIANLAAGYPAPLYISPPRIYKKSS